MCKIQGITHLRSHLNQSINDCNGFCYFMIHDPLTHVSCINSWKTGKLNFAEQNTELCSMWTQTSPQNHMEFGGIFWIN